MDQSSFNPHHSVQDLHDSLKNTKKTEKIHKKNVLSERNTHIFTICDQKQKICISHERFHSLEKMQTKLFLIPLHQTDIDRFKSDLFLLPYGPLEPMVINFTWDYSLVCVLPRWPPLFTYYLQNKIIRCCGSFFHMIFVSQKVIPFQWFCARHLTSLSNKLASSIYRITMSTRF